MALVLFALAPAATKEWRVLRDSKAHCQVSVPPEWKGGAGVAISPEWNASATVHGLSREQRLDQAVSVAKALMRPSIVFEEGPKRVWYAYQGESQGSAWYVAVAGDPVCVALIDFRDREFEAAARQIVTSLTNSR